MAAMQITLIAGADGTALAYELAALMMSDADALTVIAPVVRDRWSLGLKVSPDLDALLATRDGRPPTHAVADELRSIGYSPAWQRPSDVDIASQLVRTELLGAGYSLTEATLATAHRRDIPFRLLPQSDDRAELNIVVGDEAPHAIHITEFLATPSAHEPREIVLVAESWSVSDPVRDALHATDVLVLGPSSRTLAIDPVLRTPGLLDAIEDELPVLVLDHPDDAPTAMVRAAGLRENDPGRATLVGGDATVVLASARKVVR